MALSKEALGSGKWKKIRITVLDRDGWICSYCGGVADTVDHIYPRVKGGDTWALDNLQSLCKSCNSRKGGRFVGFQCRLIPNQARINEGSG
jgi:5-methylcytosine-specific restriction endonuclease McrA